MSDLKNETTPARRRAVRLHANDNVATALQPLTEGETVSVEGGGETLTVTLREAVARCHKFATGDIAVDHEIHKYGEVIGRARADITAGDHVHVHNLVSQRGR